jgi:hypothetical protein
MAAVKKKIVKKVAKSKVLSHEVTGSFTFNSEDGKVIKTSKSILGVVRSRDGSYTVSIKISAPKKKAVTKKVATAKKAPTKKKVTSKAKDSASK